MNGIHQGWRGTRRTVATMLCLSLGCGVAAVSVQAARGRQSSPSASAAELYQQALRQEEGVGNLEAAIDLYRRVIAAKPDRAMAARAQLRIAACYEKLGKPEAAAAYEAVVRDYADQTASATIARTWLRSNAANQSAGTQAPLSIERVWDGPAVDVEGRPSADGRYLAFVDRAKGQPKLAVRDLKTRENRLLTHDEIQGDFAENPVFSVDGKQIAYRFGEKDSTIRLINSDGTNMRVLLHDGHKNYLYAWSPDGKYLAATHSNDDRTDTIVLISTVNGSVTQLKSAGSGGPSVGGFSSDGRFLLYATNGGLKAGAGGVFLLSRDGQSETPLVQGSEQGSTNFGAPSWSPDGRRVVFASNRSGALALWSIGVASGQSEAGSLQLIRASIGSMQPMGFTQEGSFYYGMRENQVEAYTAEFEAGTLTASKPTLITDQSVGNNTAPAISPDGQSIAFIRRRANAPSEIVVRSASGKERVINTIRSGAYGARPLEWFPDGRSILVADAIQRRKQFRQINVESGEAKVLLDGPWEVWIGSLSPDGQDLYYSVKDDFNQEKAILRLRRIRLATGVETELYQTRSDGTGLFGLAVSPDGSLAAFCRNVDSERALYVMALDGATPREISRGSTSKLGCGGGMGWTKDSRHVVLRGSCGSPEREQLCAISTNGGALKPLGLEVRNMTAPSISADGRRVAFSVDAAKEELWVIRNLLAQPAKAR